MKNKIGNKKAGLCMADRLRVWLRYGKTYWPVLLVVIAGTALSFKAFMLARQANLDELQARFVIWAGERSRALEQDLVANLETAKFIGDFFNASETVASAEFAEFAKRSLQEHDALAFLAWTSRVPDNNHDTYPVSYRMPAGDNDGQGQHLLSDPVYQQALEQARDSGRLTLSGHTFRDNNDKQSLLAFWPVYTPGQATETVAQRRAHLKGLTMLGLRLSLLVEQRPAVRMAGIVPLRLHLYDLSAATPQLLYGEPLAVLPTVTDKPLLEPFRLSSRLFIGERVWLVVCDVDPAALVVFSSPTPDWVLLLGLLLTLTLAAYLMTSIRHATLVEQQVFERTEKLNFRTSELAASNTKLVKEVEARREAEQRLALQVHERDRANTELERTLLQLQETQDQLIQNEKLASLGGLVAGMAHEINTPIGVAVTAASTLSARSSELRQTIDSGQLKKSSLSSYLEIAEQSSHMILSNLERAAALIQSFKQVAVDRASSEHRRFSLSEYIDEILLSLRPRLKKTPHRIIVDCDTELVIDSYPGAYAQILTNLLINSLVHAYDEDQTGTLRIVVRREGRQLLLYYSDDGKGMNAEQVNRIFEPFYTTRRGQGGSGLGMHIVYNLVTQTLGGQIQVHSKPGQGTTFALTLPVSQAP